MKEQPEPLGFARRLADEVARTCSGALRGAYLHGSAALGGWVAQRSDVDVLPVADGEIGEERVRAVGELLAEADAVLPWRWSRGQPGDRRSGG